MVSEFVPASSEAIKSQKSTTSEVIEQFLQLRCVSKTTTLLPTKHLAEVLTFATEQITPMPHMSPWMMGTYNWRGEILWLVDFGYLLGLTPLYQQVLSTYTAAVLQFPLSNNVYKNAESQIIGLVVNQVGSIERCSPDLIQSSSDSTKNNRLEKFLRGYWLKSELEILPVFDTDAIWAEISQPSNS
ncbi:MAG: chemotaxis protein CheW [Xenococcaceae cyanobacterium MO_167.B27]|nr:chemotaxis protein CheW [Xenococcaceae cyanobacterium MO_167.B27]